MTNREQMLSAIREIRRSLDTYEAEFKNFRADDAELMTEYRLPRVKALALDVARFMQVAVNLAAYEAPEKVGNRVDPNRLRERIMEVVEDELFDAEDWLESDEVQQLLGKEFA